MRWYLTKTTGDGAEDTPYRPRAADYVATSWRCVDARGDATQPGWMLFECSPTLQEHTQMTSDADIVYLPIHGAGGAELSLTSQLSAIANPLDLRNKLESRGVPTQHLSASSTVKQLLAAIIKRLLLRQILRDMDFAIALDDPQSAIAEIRARLVERGIVNTEGATPREIVVAILGDPVASRILRSHYDD